MWHSACFWWNCLAEKLSNYAPTRKEFQKSHFSARNFSFLYEASVRRSLFFFSSFLSLIFSLFFALSLSLFFHALSLSLHSQSLLPPLAISLARSLFFPSCAGSSLLAQLKLWNAKYSNADANQCTTLWNPRTHPHFHSKPNNHWRKNSGDKVPQSMLVKIAKLLRQRVFHC